MSSDLSFVSVIVPVYNGSKFLPSCLDALVASDYDKFEVVVVDDGSTDNSAEIGRSKGAIVISSQRRQSGPAAARNLAAKKAKGDILLFVDADVVVKPDTITRVACAFAAENQISALFGSYDDKPGEKNFLSQYKNLQHHFVHQTSSREASTFWAGLGAVRREVFASVGGFDCEKFAVPSIEDIELGMRMRASGHRIVLDREIQAKHLKKWGVVSLIKTDIFCRALPWSKLILTSEGEGMVNDMNLKTRDRMSSGLVAFSIATLPMVFWNIWFIFLPIVLLLGILLLNLQMFRFFAERKNSLFAVGVFPWLFLYFFYSGMTFVFCWLWYTLPKIVRFAQARRLRGRFSRSTKETSA